MIGVGIRFGVAIALLATGCNNNPEPKPADATAEVAKPEAAAQPRTEQEFLAELAPLPDGAEAIEIRYAVTGPALTGELTILVREGGYKREQWQLRTSDEAPELRSAGLAIVNPSQIWSAPEGEPGELRANPLGALASTWAALDEPRRAAIVTAIRDWHQLLIERRASVPGDRAEILGVGCLQTRIAAQNLCMWEAVGVFLRYEGSAFNIEATKIDRSPTLAADAFELPPEASAAATFEVAPVDFSGALDEAAAGNSAALFLLVSRTRALPKLARPRASESSD